MDPLSGIVQDFAAAWRGATPRIENFLHADPDERRRLLLQLIPIDFQERLKQGQPCRIEDYLERFPDLKQDRHALSVLESTEHGRKTRVLASLPEKRSIGR